MFQNSLNKLRNTGKRLEQVLNKLGGAECTELWKLDLYRHLTQTEGSELGTGLLSQGHGRVGTWLLSLAHGRVGTRMTGSWQGRDTGYVAGQKHTGSVSLAYGTFPSHCDGEFEAPQCRLGA